MPTSSCFCRDDRYCPEHAWDAKAQWIRQQRFRAEQDEFQMALEAAYRRIETQKEFTSFLLDIVAPGVKRV